MKSLKLGSVVAVAMLFVSVMAGFAQPNGQGGQGQGQGRQQGTPEEMAKASVERLNETLKLTDDQQKAIYKINLEMMESRTKQAEGERPDREAMMKAREEMTKKIKAVLTPEQLKKYEEMEKQQQQRQGQQGQQGQRRQQQQ